MLFVSYKTEKYNQVNNSNLYIFFLELWKDEDINVQIQFTNYDKKIS